jgi:hypothetical protein
LLVIVLGSLLGRPAPAENVARSWGDA